MQERARPLPRRSYINAAIIITSSLAPSPHIIIASSGLFGDGYTPKMKSQLFLSYSKVYGKVEDGRKQRAVEVALRAVTGETRRTVVNKNTSVGDMQEAVCALFKKPFPATKIAIVANEILYDDFASRPFKTLARKTEARVLFGKINVTIKNLNGDTNEIAVDPGTSLRDLRSLLCKLFRQRFPATMATLVIGERIYDEFIEVPFQSCTGSVDANVVFSPTTDPFSMI